MTHELWILAIACLMGTCCALVGALMVLRQMAMIGDALSHNVLLGLVVAFMVTGSRSITVMFIGAIRSLNGTLMILRRYRKAMVW